MKKRHIVLGSAGFIGKSLVDFLRNQGKLVVEWDIKNDISQDCRTVDLDLRKDDTVYFLAWEVGGAKYLNRPDTQMEQIRHNISLMTNVFNQLELSGCSFVFISSQLASGDTIYGTLKRLGELWTKQLGRCSLRFWNVYGPYEEPSLRSHVVSDLIHQALRDGQIILMTSGEEERQFIHIDDICSAIEVALCINECKIYDVTSFEWLKIADVAALIAAYLGVQLTLGKEEVKPRLHTLKGKLPYWQCEVSFEDGIRKTIDLYRKHKEFMK